MSEMKPASVVKTAITCFEAQTVFSMSPNCRPSTTYHTLNDMSATKTASNKIILIFWPTFNRNVLPLGREHIPINLVTLWFTFKVFISTTKHNSRVQIKSRQKTDVLPSCWKCCIARKNSAFCHIMHINYAHRTFLRPHRTWTMHLHMHSLKDYTVQQRNRSRLVTSFFGYWDFEKKISDNK